MGLCVKAIRIYYDLDGHTPLADLKMMDGVVEHIEWTNVKQRKQFEPHINGYTFVYDERDRLPFDKI